MHHQTVWQYNPTFEWNPNTSSTPNHGCQQNYNALLTEFTPITPFPIGTIGPKPTIAPTRCGIMKLPMVEGSYENFTTYYSKDSSRSVTNPDQDVSESNRRLQRWIQRGDTESDKGSMIYLDNQLPKIATLKMFQTNEIWYARVGHGAALIDTTETPSICAA